MKRPFFTFRLYLITALFGFASISAHSPVCAERLSDKQAKSEEVMLRNIQEPFIGDLQEIKRDRMIRALVSYSRTDFFIEDGTIKGFEGELLKSYEKWLNKGIRRREKIHMVFVPMPFDQLLQALQEGRGDIAAAGLTVTKERKKQVAFTTPYFPNVDEIIVTNKNTDGVQSIYDLSARTVYVRKGSSYYSHLLDINSKLMREREAVIKIKVAVPYLGMSDILELVNAGVIDITVSGSHIADTWAKVLPDIIVHNNLKVAAGGQIAWAVRKNNPDLLADLNSFMRKRKKGSLLGNILFKRYYKDSKWIKNPNTEKEQKKLQQVIGLFQKYAKRYGFNFLALIAQAYQESELDHTKKSPSGAVGIMQVLPSTASDPNINIKNIHLIENNIHAGTKYLDFLRKRYFSASGISPDDQVFFSWAAYNAGPRKINAIRGNTAKRGFDPNKWFFNTEKIVAEVIGRETVNYVANIYKYYVAYQLTEDFYLQRTKAKNYFVNR